MRISQAFLPATFVIAVTAFGIRTDTWQNSAVAPLLDQFRFGHENSDMDPDPAQPPQQGAHEDTARGDSSLTISDILPKSRNMNIFASLTRDVSTVSDRLESSNAKDNTTLLAPLNSAMQALPRKPWEDRPGDDTDVSAAHNEDKAAQNLERFVTHHVVPISPWQAGKEHRIKTLGGQELWWEPREGKQIIHPGEVIVDGVVGKVGNGEIWALKGVVNYS